MWARRPISGIDRQYTHEVRGVRVRARATTLPASLEPSAGGLAEMPEEVSELLIDLLDSGLDLEPFGIQSRRGPGDRSGLQAPPSRDPFPETQALRDELVAGTPYSDAAREPRQERVLPAILARALASELSADRLNLLLDALGVGPGVVERSLASLGLDPSKIAIAGTLCRLAGGRFLPAEVRAVKKARSAGSDTEKWLFMLTSAVVLALIVAALLKLS